MKPVGLVDPRTGRRPFAVVQLRQDNLAASHFSMVGFQTQLKWGEQKRVFQMIPGLEQAEFVRYGHDPPQHLRQLAARRSSRPSRRGGGPGSSSPARCRASRATWSRPPPGCSPGVGAAFRARGEEPIAFPEDTALGALGRYIARSDPKHYQPTNIAFGLLPELAERVRDKAKTAPGGGRARPREPRTLPGVLAAAGARRRTSTIHAARARPLPDPGPSSRGAERPRAPLV